LSTEKDQTYSPAFIRTDQSNYEQTTSTLFNEFPKAIYGDRNSEIRILSRNDTARAHKSVLSGYTDDIFSKEIKFP
jgi:hypothetical protein